MNIERFLNNISNKKDQTLPYSSSARRSTAAMIDALITLIIRGVTVQILGMLFIVSQLQKFLVEFRDKFGTEMVKNTPEHISFVMHHRITLIILLVCAAVIFIGALYHALLNSSAWKATLGKRLMGITIEKEDGSSISFYLALFHYFLSILPFVFIFYLLSYQITHNTTFYESVTASTANIVFGLLFLLWTQIQSFTPKKVTAYDIICKIILVNKKTAAKFPWSKS